MLVCMTSELDKTPGYLADRVVPVRQLAEADLDGQVAHNVDASRVSGGYRDTRELDPFAMRSKAAMVCRTWDPSGARAPVPGPFGAPTMRRNDHADQSNELQELPVPSPESPTLAEERQRLAERIGRILARHWLASRIVPETTITTTSTAAGHADPASNGGG
jgi:hypothetical protein